MSEDLGLGFYAGQPVLEGQGGRLVYDCQPEIADGCLVPVPADFLGMPAMPGPELGPEPEPEAGG
jgi:hypothetical protein